SIGLPNDPFLHVAAVLPAADSESRRVDVTVALDDLVERAHDVDVVLAGPVAHDLAAEALPIAVGAARVHVEDDEPHAGEDLQLVEEGPSVLSVRSAVDLEHCRVHAIRIVTRRFEHPSLELPAVR